MSFVRARRVGFAAAAGSLCLGLLACATAKRQQVQVIPLTYEREAEASPSETPAAGPCHARILSLRDERSNQQSIGTTDKYLTATQMEEWLWDGIRSLQEYGYSVMDGPVAGPPDSDEVGLQIRVTRVFCRAQPEILNASVVMSVEYSRQGSSLGIRTYRGEGRFTDPNPFAAGAYQFSAGAVNRALNRAMDDAVSKIGTDLRTFCP